MATAKWNGAVLAQSDKVETVEGNKYFPPDSINREYFEDSNTTTENQLKGTARYYHIKVEGNVNVDAAWYYPNPKGEASNIKDYVTFWRGVEVED